MEKRVEGREQRGTERGKHALEWWSTIFYFQQKAGGVMTFMMSHCVM